MNYNILSYSLFVLASIYIIFWLGRYFHSNGKIFITYLFKEEINAGIAINNLLLILYYLFNMGYAIIQLNIWPPIPTLPIFIGTFFFKLSILLVLLGILHYLNMLGIYLYARIKLKTISSL